MAGKYAILMLPSLQQILHGRDDRMWNKVIFLTMLMILSLCNYLQYLSKRTEHLHLPVGGHAWKGWSPSCWDPLFYSFQSKLHSSESSSSHFHSITSFHQALLSSMSIIHFDLKNQKHHLSFNTCFSCPFPWIFLTGTHRLLNRPCSPNYHFQTDSQAQPEGLPSLHTPCLPVPTSKGPVRRVYWHKVIR